MEALALGLMFLFLVFLAGGAFFFGVLCLLALLHGWRASESLRSARAARWVGLADVCFGVLIAAAALTRSGSIGLGGFNFNVLAAIGAGVMVAAGCYAVARSWAGPAAPDVADVEAAAVDRAATVAIYLRAVVGAAAFALVTTVAVFVIATLTES